MSLEINNSSLLKGIPRKKHRDIFKLDNFNLPFIGKDVWTLYELSWLNKNGLPQVAIAKIEINITSINIVESKSLKIYINSFNQTKFNSYRQLLEILKFDLMKCVCGEVSTTLFDINEIKNENISEFYGNCIDDQNVKISSYKYNPLLLTNFSNKIVKESLYSHLLKSNCPITQQPDWASIQIMYTGQEIDHSALLAYLISFRSHNEFHEECIERIFYDIQNICKPQELTVYARYTRRGGIDINPWRTNTIFSPCLVRMARQ